MIEEMKLHNILDKQTSRWERLSFHMKNIPNQPLGLITEVFKGGDLFVAERLQQEGEHVLLEAQEYWMAYLIPALSEYFGIEEVSIQYNNEIALSPIYFVMNERVIGICSPYLRTFEETGAPGKVELLQEKRQLENTIEETEGELEIWKQYHENPTLMGEDDTWLFAKVAINPKKYKKLALEEIEKKEEELEEHYRSLREIEIKIERAEREYLETSYYLERIQNRVAKWGDFTFYAPEIEGE